MGDLPRGVPRDIIPFSVEFEEKLYSLREDPAKVAAFLEESKVKSKLEKIITEGFTKLGLYYYFTTGEKEIRCWTVQKGCWRRRLVCLPSFIPSYLSLILL